LVNTLVDGTDFKLGLFSPNCSGGLAVTTIPERWSASAKQLATMDHVGGGRAGVNIVAGWNQPEYEAMGIELPTDHDDRYALAQEWWDHVRTLWTRPGRGDLDGRFYALRNVEAEPKPVQGVLPVLNAGSSPQGRDFAARNANFVFTIIADANQGAAVVAGLTERARRQYGRDVGVMSPAHVVCRPTQAEAEDYLRYYADEHADWDRCGCRVCTPSRSAPRCWRPSDLASPPATAPVR
jgi:FMNH2-dependent dimethyl sulfone monooxygenase